MGGKKKMKAKDLRAASIKEDYKLRFCPFCGEEKEDTEDFENVENRYEDWN